MRCSAESSSREASCSPSAGVAEDVPGGLHQGAQVVLVPDDLGIALHMGNGGHQLGQLGQVHLAGGLVEVPVLLKLLQYGDKVHRQP